MKLLKIFCVIALVFAVSAIAYAETQSVKISGDVTMRAFARGHYNLTSKASGANAPGVAGVANVATVSNDWDTFLQSTAEVQVDADLTDNVAAVIRLVNQRVWGQNNQTNSGITNNAAEVVADSANSYEVVADLAYIELKEFLYAPLTLRIGRQDLWFGRGFIIGNSLMNPTDSLYAPEYTAINSFDAIRATLDYDPWTIDLVYAKIDEHQSKADDDINLWGVNIGYVFDQYNAEAELYYWYNQDRLPQDVIVGVASTDPVYGNDTHVFGVRGSMDPIEDWTIALEAAYQGGQIRNPYTLKENERSAWAIDAEVECRVWQDDFSWKPVASLEYIFYSGQTSTDDGVWHGWNRMYRGKFDTAIREFQGTFYPTAQNGVMNNSTTNQHQLLVKGVIEPMDDVTVTGKYAFFWLDKNVGIWSADTTSGTGSPNTGTSNTWTDRCLGSEVDILVNWDYTEDVSFNLLAGWFIPGGHFESPNNRIATDVVGTVKLSF